MSVEPKRYLDRFDSAGRKRVPMYSGVMAYFPDAIAALAEHSFKGNEKHNPGEPLHHARGKSMDHTDCIMRHLANYNGLDGDALEAVALFWRAGALCQEVLERKFGLTLPDGVVDARAFPETNSLVGPNGEQAPAELPKPDPHSRAAHGLPPRAGEPKKGKLPKDFIVFKCVDCGGEIDAATCAYSIGPDGHHHSTCPKKPEPAWPHLDPECISGN